MDCSEAGGLKMESITLHLIKWWLSVNPLMDKYPDWSPDNYVKNILLVLVDQDGMEILIVTIDAENGVIIEMVQNPFPFGGYAP